MRVNDEAFDASAPPPPHILHHPHVSSYLVAWQRLPSFLPFPFPPSLLPMDVLFLTDRRRLRHFVAAHHQQHAPLPAYLSLLGTIMGTPEPSFFINLYTCLGGFFPASMISSSFFPPDYAACYLPSFFVQTGITSFSLPAFCLCIPPVNFPLISCHYQVARFFVG